MAHLCLKFAGLAQAKTATYFLESNEYETIFAVTFTTIVYSLFLIGEEVIGPSLMPVFVSELEEKDEPTAWNLPSALLTVQTLILILVTIVIMVFPDLVIWLFTDWTRAANPNKYALMRESIQWLAPCLIFLSLGSTTYIILNSYKKFFLAAFGDASWKICVVISLIVGYFLGLGYRALFFGLLVGSAAKLLTHLAGMLKKLKYLRVSFDLKSRAFRAMVLLMLPLLAGIIFAKFRDVFNVRVLTHIDHRGVVQSADLGRKLFSTVSWLVPFTLQIALFPFLCDLAERNDKEQLGRVLTKSCRLLAAVFIPGALVLAALSERFSVFVFLGGKTGLQVVVWTGIATACYVLVLPAAAVECVLMQGYFAKRKMVSVSIIGITCSSLSVLISFLFVIKLEVGPKGALLAVALGFVFSRIIKSIVLSVVLGRSVPLFPFLPTLGFLGKLALIGVAAGAATWGSVQLTNRLADDQLQASKARMWSYEHCKLKAAGIRYVAAAQRYSLRGEVELTTDLLDIRTHRMDVRMAADGAVLEWQEGARKQILEVRDEEKLGSSLHELLRDLPRMLAAGAPQANQKGAKIKLEAGRTGGSRAAGVIRLSDGVKAEDGDLTAKAGSLVVRFTAAGQADLQLRRSLGDSITLRNEPMPPIKRRWTLIHLAIGGLVGGLVFLLAALLLRVKEPFDMLRWGVDKVRRKSGH